MIRNVFTVDVEEYFQVEAFSGLIPKKDWHKFPSRVETTTKGLLELLDAHHVRGTFFVLGWIAKRHPELIEKIRRRKTAYIADEPRFLVYFNLIKELPLVGDATSE